MTFVARTLLLALATSALAANAWAGAPKTMKPLVDIDVDPAVEAAVKAVQKFPREERRLKAKILRLGQAVELDVEKVLLPGNQPRSYLSTGIATEQLFACRGT